MESIRGIFGKVIAQDERQVNFWEFIAIALVSFGIGCIDITLFEAELAPFAIALALALRFSEHDPLPALIGGMVGSAAVQSLSTFIFCCFAAPALLFPRKSRRSLRAEFILESVSLTIPSIIMGRDGFIGIASYLLSECVLLMAALAICLLIINQFLGKQIMKQISLLYERYAVSKKNPASWRNAASTNRTERSKVPAMYNNNQVESDIKVALNTINVKATALAEVLMEVSSKCDDALTGRQLQSIGDCLNRLTVIEPRKLKRFEVSIGTALIPKRFNSVTGDSYIIRSSGSRVLAALSDGMGSGTTAEAESLKTLELMEKLIGVGFSLAEAADCVNMLMLERVSSEMYATLDAVLIDLATGEMQMLKSGAAPGYLICGNEIRTLYSEALPIGIIRDIAPAISNYAVRNGDMLIMMTDGVSDALGIELIAAIHEHVSALSDPEDIANALLDDAKLLSSADDMSIIVIKITGK